MKTVGIYLESQENDQAKMRAANELCNQRTRDTLWSLLTPEMRGDFGLDCKEVLFGDNCAKIIGGYNCDAIHVSVTFMVNHGSTQLNALLDTKETRLLNTQTGNAVTNESIGKAVHRYNKLIRDKVAEHLKHLDNWDQRYQEVAIIKEDKILSPEQKEYYVAKFTRQNEEWNAKQLERETREATQRREREDETLAVQKKARDRVARISEAWEAHVRKTFIPWDAYELLTLPPVSISGNQEEGFCVDDFFVRYFVATEQPDADGYYEILDWRKSIKQMVKVVAPLISVKRLEFTDPFVQHARTVPVSYPGGGKTAFFNPRQVLVPFVYKEEESDVAE